MEVNTVGKDYRLHELNDDSYEKLVGHICMKVLGTGTITFSPGKDGGRDGKFNGTANKFPSESSPITGKMIIQAKHTKNPVASCSDKPFEKVIEKEIPKIENLIKNGELEYYLLFTNRKLPAGKEDEITKKIRDINGVKEVFLLAIPQTHSFLDNDNAIWKSMGFDKFDNPLQISSEEIGEVIHAFHNEISDTSSPYNSSSDFTYPGIEKKNQINGVTEKFYEYMKNNSMKYFEEIAKFLKNPRYKDFDDKYHATADELKMKLIKKRESFENFDDVLVHVYDLIVQGNPYLKEKRRLASVFLHYMYFDCDIGEYD